jgi:UPF0716 family protein affecting phage T7 exclusion
VSAVKPRLFHVGAFVAVAAAMGVLISGLHIAWFFAAAAVMLACNVGGWVLERKQKRLDS